MTVPPDQGPPVWTVHEGPAAPPPASGLSTRVRLAVVGTAVAVLLVVSTGVVLVGATVENRAVRTLLDRVERSESVMRDFQTQVDALGDELSLEKVAPIAAASKPELEQAREDVARSSTVPWFAAVRKARDAYLAHADAWIAAMGDWAAQRGTDSTGEIDRTFAEACDALRAAVPVLEGDDDADRVEEICTTPSPGAGGRDSLPV